MRIRTIFLLIFLLLAGPWNAEAALPAGVSIHRLDNGMEVLMIRNPGLPMTGANVAVKVGSAYETFATSGMSHMLEHLLFNGTDSRTQKELYDDTDRIGGYNNANTSEYYTNYMMVTPREHFEKGLSIQADMLFHSTLPEKKFDKEKGIVLEEISKSLAEPREQLERNLISQIWRGHAMSLPTLGTYSTIKFMKRDDVYRFYKNNYVPNNMILSVVGDFDPAEMLGLINRIYGEQAASDILRPDHREWKTGPDATLPDTLPSGAVYRTYDGKELVTHDLFIPDGNLNPARIHLAELLLKEKTDPLFKTLDSEFPGMLKNVYLTLRTSPFRNFVEVKSVFQKGDHREKISRRIGELMKEMTLEIPSETLEKESLTSRTRYLQDIEKPHMFGIYNAHNFAVHGIGTVMDLYGGKEFGSAAEELKRVRFTGPLFTLIQSPAGPGDGEADSGETKTELFSDPAKGKSLLITENGGSELLAIHYLFKHKASLESKYGKDMARVLHHCFENRLKSPPLSEQLAPFGLTWKVNDNPFFPMDDVYLHPDFGYIRVEGLAENTLRVLEILNRELFPLKPSEEEFQRAVSETARMKSPMMMGDMAKKLFDKLISQSLYDPSPYPDPPEEVTFEKFSAFAGEYFTPSNLILFISTPEKAGTVNEALEILYQDTAGESLPAWSEKIRMRTAPEKIEKNGMGNRSYLYWGFTRDTDPGDRAALQALSLYLSDRIVFDVREKRGMAYRMSAGIQFSGDTAAFYINMGTRPENVDRLMPDIPGFFTPEYVRDLDDNELERLISMYLGRMSFRRLSSINRGFYLSSALYFTGDHMADEKFFEQLKKVKAAEVKKAAAKYLKGGNTLTVIVR